MKSARDVRIVIERRLERTWHLDAAGEEASWPFEIPLGKSPSNKLAREFAPMQQQVHDLRDWGTSNGLGVRDGNRRVYGTTQPFPTHVIVPDLRTAAAACGAEWTKRIVRGRERVIALRDRNPACNAVAWVVRSVDDYTDRDFELLLTVADWFKANNAEGLTPRQVPLPGVHAKWLNTHRPVIEALAGSALNLAPRHPARIHFTYLDPDHLAAGGRRFDSAAVGDTMDPAYRPEVVIIAENKDTAIHFPLVPGGIAVEGAGYGGATVAAFTWIVSALTLAYWGDLDAAGFEILDGYRRDGVPATSILMDLETYRAYAPWGTFHHPNGRPIESIEPKSLVNLTDAERVAYRAVCDPGDGLPPRVEQERIPLHVAHAALSAASRV
jgi:hypothetical protein